MVRAKLIGFTWRPDRIDRRFPRSDNSLPARYARAIAAYRTAVAPALKQIDALIQSAAGQSLFLGTEGPGAARERQYRPTRSRRSARPFRSRPSRACSRFSSVRLWSRPSAKATSTRRSRTSPSGFRPIPTCPIGYRALARAYALKNDIPWPNSRPHRAISSTATINDAKNPRDPRSSKIEARFARLASRRRYRVL